MIKFSKTGAISLQLFVIVWHRSSRINSIKLKFFQKSMRIYFKSQKFSIVKINKYIRGISQFCVLDAINCILITLLYLFKLKNELR